MIEPLTMTRAISIAAMTLVITKHLYQLLTPIHYEHRLIISCSGLKIFLVEKTPGVINIHHIHLWKMADNDTHFEAPRRSKSHGRKSH